MTTTTRPQGAIATTLDPESLLKAGRAKYAEQCPEADASLLTNAPLPQMLIPVNRGEVAIVNGEGVGNIADENGNIEVWFAKGFQYVPLELSLEEVAGTVTDEKIDLADGIRTFGARLDSNHYTWFRKYDTNQ